MPVAAEAQQAGKVYRIGYLGTVPPPPHMWEPLLEGLRERGWVEGRNIVLERRFSEGWVERFPDLAAELVQLRLDILLTAGGAAPARAAMAATTTIPIVMVTAGDPMAEKLVASLARPGGNVTGLSMVHEEISGKRLELLKEVAPKISRVAVLYGGPVWKELDTAAKTLRVKLVPALADTPDQFPEAFTTVTRERADALNVVESALNFGYRQLIVDFAASNRLPAIGGWREFAEAGGLISYGVNLADLFRRAAGYVDKILRGARAGDLPIEQPTKFELVINLKTGKALGLTIPQSVLIRADKVIR